MNLVTGSDDIEHVVDVYFYLNLIQLMLRILQVKKAYFCIRKDN